MTERGKKRLTEAYIRLRQERDTKSKNASDLNSWFFPHICCTRACMPPCSFMSHLLRTNLHNKLICHKCHFPLHKSMSFPSSKSDFTLLWSKTQGPAIITHLWYPFYSQPVRTHSSLPLWWLALAKERSHLPLHKIWLVAKIRPVQRIQILFTITVTRPELAGLHLCVSMSRRKT